ncbi:putative ubiquitin carboxyl-terminal hydrolase 50 isoform X2 [Salarias fasciatus]|nr:putative ubiquitin carboxyl-terminal hydrolase 50 isoform X2 [Salarias fasciatus]
MVYCRECSQKTEGSSASSPASAEHVMVEFPQIMTLLLKRFHFDFNTVSDVKSNCCVEVPFEIQMMNKSYTLYGMVNHMGSLGGGHYTATVWSREDNTWWRNSLEAMRLTEMAETVKSMKSNISSSAYLLMYRASESQIEEFIEEEDKPNPHKQRFRRNLVFIIVYGSIIYLWYLLSCVYFTE